MGIVVGASVDLTFTFAAPNGALYDPSPGTVVIRKPDVLLANATTYTIAQMTRTSIGVYVLRIQADQPGRWNWTATGRDVGNDNRVDTSNGSFYVDFSRAIPVPA